MNIRLIKTITWIFVALVVAVAIQIPMLWHGDYAFLLPNTLIVMLTILSIRHTINFDEIAIHTNKWGRYLIFVFNIFIFIYLLNRLELLTGIIDSMDMGALIKSDSISLMESVELFKYIHKEYLVLSIASFVAMFTYNLKILRSFWKKSNVKRERKLV